MRIYDISMTVQNDMPVYKNKEEKKPILEQDKVISSDGINESILHINLHTGTHIDAPYHVDKDGSDVKLLDIRDYITPCKVIDFTSLTYSITEEDLLDKGIEKNDFIILKTKNSYIATFDFNFVFLEESGAKYLKDIGVKGVGIDCLGIERSQIGHITHKILLQNNIAILEGLRLKGIREGSYTLIALPLKIKGADGSPTRAILIDGNLIE